MLNRKTVVSSLLWKFFERSGTQVTQFVVSIVLARLLLPEDFGLVALVTVFIAVANVFVQSGLNTALIQKKDADDLDFSSVFIASLFMAFVLYTVLFFTAPYIALFYNKSELTLVLRVLSLTLFLGAINSIQVAYISKHMMFKKLFWRSVLAILPSAVLGIVLALLGFGVWALVFQQLSNVFLSIMVMFFGVFWRPQLGFSFLRLKGLFSFGWKLLLSSLIDTGYSNLRSLIIGKLFTPSALAFYNRGEHFPYIIVNNLNTSIQSVMLPSLAAIQDDRQRVKRLMRRAIVTSTFLIIPLMAGLALAAKPLVLILLGEKWLDAVPFVQIYCAVFAFYPIHTSNLSAINALGRSDVFLKLEIIKKVIGMSLLLLFLWIFRSPMGIAYGVFCNTLVSAFVNAHPNKKFLDYGYLEQMKDILPSFAISFVMVIPLFGLAKLGLNAYVTFLMQVLLGGAVYFGLAKLLHFECLDYLIQTVLEIRKKHGK